jgi:hypothetical protein
MSRRCGRSILVLAGMLAAGCASLDARPSLEPSAIAQPTRAYLYGRFQLRPDSASQPRLFLQLTNMGTGESLIVHLRNAPLEMYVIDVTPGQYEFTQMVSAPGAAMEKDVRRDNLRFPAQMSFMGQPFDVEAGKAYYVGDWFGAVSRDVEFYLVFSRIKSRWGIYQLAYDYEGATTALRRLYPALGTIETLPAWRRGGDRERSAHLVRQGRHGSPIQR